MSADGNSRTNVPSNRDSHAGSRDHDNDNRANKNIDKTTKQPVNFVTPPELQRNEAAARVSSRVQRVAEQSSDQPEVEEHEDEDDPCLSKKKTKEPVVKSAAKKLRATPGVDPRFQQQNQTLRCFVMYTDFYRCEKILGDGHEACTWFRDVFTSICPNAWIQRWDELREEGRLPWSKGKTQGTFPGDRYGV